MADAPRILLTGASGQVGYELLRALAPLGEVLAPGRSTLDLTKLDALRAEVRRLRPSLIVNAAAYTDVERAEDEPDLAHVVNAEAPGVLAAEAASAGIVMVHFSTDYVFDGTAAEPYREEDGVGPLNAYGRSKLEGERAVAAAGGAHLLLRTSWVYGKRGKNFLATISRLARERTPLRVVHDQVGAPTWSRMIAQGAALALGRLRTDAGFALPEAWSGTYHLSAAGATTWCGLARAIVSATGAPCTVEPIRSDERPSRAARPRYSVLSSDRFAERFGIRLPAWETQLALCLAEAGAAHA